MIDNDIRKPKGNVPPPLTRARIWKTLLHQVRQRMRVKCTAKHALEVVAHIENRSGAIICCMVLSDGYESRA